MASANENQKAAKDPEHHEPSASASAAAAAQPPSEEETKKWGTHIMGAPAAPTVHPDNQQAALWQAQTPAQQYYQHQPYVVYSPVEKPADNPFEFLVNTFNSWNHRAEDMARNVWHNLKTGPSVSGAAWGKVNLTAKAITEGGFESLFRQIFPCDANEKLKKTFACYLSTTTGPVAGTLYLSTARLAFCSDRPLSFNAPSGQVAWSYYKVAIPSGNIENVNPVMMRQNPPENYIHIITVDGHEFWFMGFVNFEKASHHLLDSVSDFRATLNVPATPHH
ncbi:hypothetical protein ABFS82_11G077700 [Erythranthe guttata]|uniref:GRAM domain-containing protein n=1 Tax=Erythranthe guttata TaxID=4155 RepID=A0A022RBH4_ERYGU|nr:PREDICTED: GEM-like protein 5 [Erythranthe guttata]EYU37364.1 hypothetical protein MIMGU_mgv1a011577mg [Erythranthe guttata]|eukprot:XP_012837523.1 PREDICTED: GEM-like protein 5 [Erythranthe guttata]